MGPISRALCRAFGFYRSIDSITAPMKRIVNDLKAHSMRHRELAYDAGIQADINKQRERQALLEATRAEVLMKQYEALIPTSD